MPEAVLNILIVDDEPNIADAFAKQIKLIGKMNAEVASGGKEALEKIATNKFDVVLLDLIMPEVDGVEVLKSMRAEPEKYPPVPTIVLTNVSSEDAKKQTAEFGAVKYIVKTDIDPNQLIMDIKSVANNNQALRQLKAA